MNPAQLSLRALIRVYQVLLSPILPRHACRFLPTCSSYAMDAIATHGTLRGLALAARRLSRCHPWGGDGVDPVPPPRTRPDTQHTHDASCRRAHHLSQTVLGTAYGTTPGHPESPS